AVDRDVVSRLVSVAAGFRCRAAHREAAWLNLDERDAGSWFGDGLAQRMVEGLVGADVELAETIVRRGPRDLAAIQIVVFVHFEWHVDLKPIIAPEHRR